MSRIGKTPVVLPPGVTVEKIGNDLHVRGPKGALKQAMPGLVDFTIEKSVLKFNREGDDRQARANHGLMRALAANMVQGVTTGFEKKLSIQGVGFKAETKGRDLVLTIGLSHPVVYAVPDGINILVDKVGGITVQGIDKQQVGQVASVIRGFRKPDSYKGKGIRYLGENVRIKAGKSATK